MDKNRYIGDFTVKSECKPVISVIVPIYKVEKYLYKGVESVLNQTYRNLEVILVDDGSPDACGRIADEFGKRDRRVKVIHKKNGGLSDARNAGLEIASGKYVYFFDSDDYIDEQLLEKAICPFGETETDLVCFNYIECDESTGKTKQTLFPAKVYKKNGKGLNLVVNAYMGYNLGYCVWNKLYKLNIIKNNRIKFVDNSKIFSEDICFNLFYISYCKNIQVIPDYLYHYLLRETSIMGQSKKEPRINQFIEISKAYEIYLEQHFKESVMNDYQEIIFSLLMKLQLGKVSRAERLSWIGCIKHKSYFYKKSDAAVKNIAKWIDCYGPLRGIKKWLIFIGYYYYGKESSLWFFFLRRFVSAFLEDK